MKLTIKVKKEVDVKYLRVKANVRYWEDTYLNGKEDEEGLIPCREGNYWCPLIDIDKGIIVNWVKGNIADVHYKVCDYGEYFLEDEYNEVLQYKDGYVPKILCPEENGYGDYIIMKIDSEGNINNWPKEPDLKEFKK